MKKLALFLFIGGAFLFSAGPANADYVTYPPGCYTCTPHYSLTGFYEDCTAASNNSNGDGIYCKEYQTLLVRWCLTSGGACYYTEVGGGGGGAGGGRGTGGSSCNTDDGWCPVDCFSCGGELY